MGNLPLGGSRVFDFRISLLTTRNWALGTGHWALRAERVSVFEGNQRRHQRNAQRICGQ